MAPTLLRAALAAAALAVTAGCSAFGGKAAEEPVYTAVTVEEPFEIRDYAAFAVAKTTVAAEDREDAVDEGFRRLFKYISGANTGGAEIAMTAPVITGSQPAAEGEKIAMTAPVIQSGNAGEWETAFVLPEDMTAAAAPAPTDARVAIATVPARRVAVIRFSGFFTAENVAENRALLEGWLATRGIEHEGDWQSAGYNPPWTIPALRRNEVLVTLSE